MSTNAQPGWITIGGLTPLAALTRKRLCVALDQRFFSRYFNPEAIRVAAYVVEMQQHLHPTY